VNLTQWPKRHHLATLLGQVSMDEYDRDHPLLSAIVVSKENGHPLNGFPDMVRQCCPALKSDDCDEAIWGRELARAHTYWTTHRR